jgi:hypothetical protein
LTFYLSACRIFFGLLLKGTDHNLLIERSPYIA